MLIRELSNELKAITDALPEDSYLLESLSSLEDAHRWSTLALSAVVGASANQDGMPQFRGQVLQRIEKLKPLSPRRMFEALNTLQVALQRSLGAQCFEDGSPTSTLWQQVSDFSDKYEVFLQGYQPKEALILFSSASSLLDSINAVRPLLIGISEKLVAPVPSGAGGLSLVLWSNDPLPVVARKLKALAIIYDELCQLTDQVSLAPLEVRRLESGSLSLDVAGLSHVIETMTDLIRNAASWIYRTYTKEGRVAALPRKVEAVESVLHLSERLERNGIDTSGIRDHLEKASVTIARELGELLAGEPKVELNNVVVSVSDALEAKFIEDSRELLLEGSDDSVD